MSWSTTKPSAASFNDSNNVDSSVTGGSYGHAMFTANISRGANNTVYVRVQFKRAAYNGYDNIDISGTATIGGESVTATGKWGAYSASYTTFATRYYTGTAAAGATVTVTCNIASLGNRSVSLTAPAYTSTYTVSYNGNTSDGGSTASQTKNYGTNITLRANGFTKSGYTFLRWNTKPDGTGTSYNAGATYSANASATMYAQWQLNTYTVSFDGNGADGGSTAAQTKYYGQPLTLPQNGFTKAGYTFLYWNTKADGTGDTYNAGSQYTTNEAVTLYAIWKKNNIPVFINVNGTIKQVEKAYYNDNGTIKECTVYYNDNGTIRVLA